MKFTLIDIEKWDRKEYYYHFKDIIPCTYSMTTKIDVTNIVRKKLKVYPAIIYAIIKTVNRFVEFRTTINADGELGYFDEMLPCYTMLNKSNGTFSLVWSEFDNDYEKFYENYKSDMEKYIPSRTLIAKGGIPQNSISISMIPWEHFDGFNLNLEKGYNYLLPIFTMGKYIKSDDKYLMPISIQVHHSVCDGFHLCRFLESLRKEIERL